MKTLYETMSNYYKYNNIDWNYYLNDLAFPKNINDARKFIDDFFAYAGKSYLIRDILQECETLRVNHTLSVFFIGLLIKNSSFHDLKIIDNDQNEIFEFSYLWFLVSLFHDMGYIQEKDWTYKFDYRKKSKDFEKIMKENKIYYNHSFYKRMPFTAYYDLGITFPVPSRYVRYHTPTVRTKYEIPYYNGISFNNGTTIKKSMYTSGTIFNYLEYCKMNPKINHYDHGIVGGLWLYDSLVKNYYLSFSRNKSADFNDFYINDLHFSTSQFPIFAYLADCIISHNMWFATDDYTIEQYEKYGLKQLTPPYAQPVQFNRNPILFILALADTLEPIKTCSNLDISPLDVLNNIECEFNHKQITLAFKNNDMFNKMTDKINRSTNWLDINVHINNKNNEIVVIF